jgi:hypothetical protein
MWRYTTTQGARRGAARAAQQCPLKDEADVDPILDPINRCDSRRFSLWRVSFGSRRIPQQEPDQPWSTWSWTVRGMRGPCKAEGAAQGFRGSFRSDAPRTERDQIFHALSSAVLCTVYPTSRPHSSSRTSQSGRPRICRATNCPMRRWAMLLGCTPTPLVASNCASPKDASLPSPGT